MSDYEAEQAALREEYGTDSGEEEDLPQVEAPEVDPKVYKDVEPLLFRGFLCLPAEINGVPFVFKSLNHQEFEKLQLLSSFQARRKAENEFDNLFLAYGVLLVDGKSVIKDREEILPVLVEAFSEMNSGLKQHVIRYLSEINRRAAKASVLTEAYSMEVISRIRWAQYRGLDLTSPSVTGFEGTESLGLNWAQLSWRRLNYFEDLKEQSEREWENAKFIASAMAGKGMSRIYSQDRQRRRGEKAERLERKDKILRYAFLGEPLDGTKVRPNLQIARTVGELQSQLESSLRGEQDYHDQVIEQYERNTQEQRNVQLAQMENLRASRWKEDGGQTITTKKDHRVFSPKEAEAEVQRRQHEVAERLAESKPLVDLGKSEFYDKWLDSSRIVPVRRT
jgi:hypothetical protein